MLLWGEKRRTVEVTAACLGPPDQPVLWISWKKNSIAWGCSAAPPARESKLIRDYPWKHHTSVVVSSPADSNTEGPILSRNLLWRRFNMFSCKGSNLCHLQGIFPLELFLSLLHLRGMDPARTGRGARLMSMHYRWYWAGNLLHPVPGQGSLSIMGDRPAQMHNLSYKCFTSSFEHCFPSACWPHADLYCLVGHPGHHHFQPLPPSSGLKLLPALHVSPSPASWHMCYLQKTFVKTRWLKVKMPTDLPFVTMQAAC